MPALLARLKAAGVRMAVFSNKADEFARAVVARYFDADLFEVVRGALPDVPTKPAPEGTRGPDGAPWRRGRRQCAVRR